MITKIPSSPMCNSYYDSSEPVFEIDYDVSSIDSDNDGYGGADDDFSEYMWMEHQEEFDKLEIERLEEEALMEQCIEAMLQDELEEELDKARLVLLIY